MPLDCKKQESPNWGFIDQKKTQGQVSAPSEYNHRRDGGLYDVETCERYLMTLAQIVHDSGGELWAIEAFEKYEQHVIMLRGHTSARDRASALLERARAA